MGNFWKDTRRKVIQRQRNKVQSWFVKHPLSFGAILGLKGLTWDLPKWGVTSIYGKYGVKTKKVEKPTGETVTVVEHMDSNGDISTTTMTTRTSEVIAKPRKHKALATVSPAERARIMKSSKQLLERTPLGKRFILLAGEIDGFQPVRAAEAVSTMEMLHQSSRGFARISMGVEAFTDVVAACGLSRQITADTFAAAERTDHLAKTMQRAYKQVLALYEGQIAQDMSGTASVSSIPVPRGTGDEAAGIWPHSSAIGNYYGLFEPDLDAEATQVFQYLGISQAGFALLSDMLIVMPHKLRRHGIDKKVRNLIGGAASDALDTSATWSRARKTMLRLYQGQMAHEASGVSTIRSTPLKVRQAA